MTTDKSNNRSPFSWVPTLYMAEGFPYFAVAIIAGFMFKSLGVPNDEIAYWTGAIGFAWVFKPLWSPFLEVIRSKKYLSIGFQVLGGLFLGLVALSLQLPNYFAVCIALLGMVAIASATHDIAADGLYILSLNNKQQAAFAGWQGAFYNVARFASLSGLLVLAGHLEKTMPPAQAWGVVFGLLAAIMLLLAAYHSWSLPNTKSTQPTEKLSNIFETSKEVIVDFFKKPGIWMMILFILLFRAGEGQIQTIGPLFLKEARENGGLGLSTSDLGVVYGFAGSTAFIAGSILGGYFASWLGLRKALPWLIIAMNFPNIVFFFLSTTLPTDLTVIAIALSFEMFGYGFGFVGLILFMMQVVAVGNFTTAHYALATGVMQLGLVIPKMISGKIQMAIGYHTFFIWVLISALPVLFLCRFMKIKDKDSNTTESAPPNKGLEV
jgi:PAT family beta-lactamase induction signal transducer AmpG